MSGAVGRGYGVLASAVKFADKGIGRDLRYTWIRFSTVFGGCWPVSGQNCSRTTGRGGDDANTRELR